LDLVPEVLPGEAPTQRQQSPGSRRSRDPDEGGRRRAVPLIQVDRFQLGLESQVVLRHEPPPGATEAQREAAQAPSVVELGADDVRGTSVARVVGADQGAEGGRAEGRARGLQTS
jgi:hypothetical protein